MADFQADADGLSPLHRIDLHSISAVHKATATATSEQPSWAPIQKSHGPNVLDGLQALGAVQVEHTVSPYSPDQSGSRIGSKERSKICKDYHMNSVF